MRLLLIRHAQSVNNGLYERTGNREDRHPDPLLTPLGEQQAQALADWAAQDPTLRQATHLYTSLMTRAVQTAAPLAHALGLPVHALPAAHECGGTTSGPAGNFAPIPGHDHAALLAYCPALNWPEHLHGQPWDGGAEAWDHAVFRERARSVLGTLQERHADGPGVIALITHSDFTQFLLAELMGHLPSTDPDAGTFFQTHNTGTTLLHVTAQGTRLAWVNRVTHLPDELLDA